MKSQACRAEAPGILAAGPGAFQSQAWPQRDSLWATWSEPSLSPLTLVPPSIPRLSAEREPSGVDVHFGDANELEWRGKAERGCQGGVAEEVGQLIPLLQLKGRVVEHPAVQAAGLLDLQLVDVSSEAHELPGQLLVLEPHLCLEGERPDLGQQGARWIGILTDAMDHRQIHLATGTLPGPKRRKDCSGMGSFIA